MHMKTKILKIILSLSLAAILLVSGCMIEQKSSENDQSNSQPILSSFYLDQYHTQI